MEADIKEQLINQLFPGAGVVDAQFIPLVDSRKEAEMRMGWKK